jgi:hypothetical protein
VRWRRWWEGVSFLAIAVIFPVSVYAILNASKNTQSVQQVLGRTKFNLSGEDPGGYRSVLALVLNLSASKFKRWPPQANINPEGFVDYVRPFNAPYLGRFDIGVVWDNYQGLLDASFISATDERCDVLGTANLPMPIEIEINGRPSLAAVTKANREQVVVFQPIEGLVVYSCPAFFRAWKSRKMLDINNRRFDLTSVL